MTASDQALLAYLKRVQQLKDQASPAESQAEMRAIAQELGLREADLAAADEEARKRLRRATGFLEHGRPQDALKDLEEAVALRPFDIEVLSALARAHAELFKRTGDADHRRQAEAMARHCLELVPDHAPSFGILNTLDAPRKQGISKTLLLGIGGAAAGVAVMALLIGRPSPTVEPAPSEAPVVSPPVKTSTPPTSTAPTITAPTTTAPPLGHVDVPLEMPASPYAEGLTLKVHRSYLNNLRSASFFHLRAALHNHSKEEIRSAIANVVLLNEKGESVAVRKQYLLASMSNAPARPGDVIPIKLAVKTDPSVRAARLEFTGAERSPAASKYDAATPLNLLHAIKVPSHIKVGLALREFHARKSSKGGQFITHVLEVTNQGETALRKLKIQIAYKDAKGTLLKTAELYPAGVLQPELFPGEMRVMKRVTSVPAEDPTVEFSLVDVEG